jgi:hypothetical protein
MPGEATGHGLKPSLFSTAIWTGEGTIKTKPGPGGCPVPAISSFPADLRKSAYLFGKDDL